MIYEYGVEEALFDFDDDADFIQRDAQTKRFGGSTLFSSPTGGLSIPFTKIDKNGVHHPRSQPVVIPNNVDGGGGDGDNKHQNIRISSLAMRQAIEVESPRCGDCGSPDWYTDGGGRALINLDDIHNRHHHHHHLSTTTTNNNNNNNNTRECQRHVAGHQLQNFAESMLTLEELKDHFNSCFTCGVSWSEEHVSLDCLECGGYSRERPCPICDGKCDRIWRRDLTMTHALRKAHWEGECGLATQEQEAIFRKNLVEVAEESLTKALKDLNASSSS